AFCLSRVIGWARWQHPGRESRIGVTRRSRSMSAVSFKQGLNLLAGSFVLASHLNSFQSPSVGVCNFAVAERPPFFKRALRSTGAEDDQRRPVLCVYSCPHLEIESTHSPHMRSQALVESLRGRPIRGFVRIDV